MLRTFLLFAAFFGFTGVALGAFAAHGLKADVVLTAVDADVIKTYVRLGLGIGIVASMAYDAAADSDLICLPVDHLFEGSVTHIGFRRSLFLRGYMYEFLRLFAPHLTQDIIDELAAISDAELRQKRTLALISELPEAK